MKGSNNRYRRGNAALEGSLILLVLVMLIIGILDFGQFLFFHQVFTDRARAGARFGVVNTYSPDEIRNYVVYNSTTAPTDGSPGLFGLQPSMVTVNRYDQGTDKDRIEVVISNSPMQFFSPLLAGTYTPRPFKAVMMVEGLGATN